MYVAGVQPRYYLPLVKCFLTLKQSIRFSISKDRPILNFKRLGEFSLIFINPN